jgi:hypothetical protein
MIINHRIETIIAEIPPQQTILDTWTYRILTKNSASPTLLFLANEGRNIPDFKQGNCPNKLINDIDGPLNKGVCIKAWCAYAQRGPTPAEGGLQYEKKVYSDIIREILHEDPDRPFLRYLGDDSGCTTVGKFAVFLGIHNPNSIQFHLIKLAFFVCNFLSLNPRFKRDFLGDDYIIDFLSGGFYRTFFQRVGIDGQNLFVNLNDNNTISGWEIGGIITTRMAAYNTFQQIMPTPNRVAVFRELLRGLYIINGKQLVHNDIHPGNTMVVNPGQADMKVLIYDWDRAYTPRFGDNPSLSNNPMEAPCLQSQCNRFMNGRPIDLLKVLLYFTPVPAIFYEILRDGLRIQNFVSGGVTFYNRILNGIRVCSPGQGNHFYVYNNQTSLYQEGLCPPLEDAIALIGSWDVLYRRAFPDDPMDIVFAFKKRKGRVSKNENSEKYISKGKKMSSDMKKKYISMKKQMKKSETNFLTKEMKNKLDKLLKIPLNELTGVQYFEIENLINYMSYGPPEPLEEMPVFNFKTVDTKPKPFWKILHDNENRKGEQFWK